MAVLRNLERAQESSTLQQTTCLPSPASARSRRIEQRLPFPDISPRFVLSSSLLTPLEDQAISTAIIGDNSILPRLFLVRYTRAIRRRVGRRPWIEQGRGRGTVENVMLNDEDRVEPKGQQRQASDVDDQTDAFDRQCRSVVRERERQSRSEI